MLLLLLQNNDMFHMQLQQKSERFQQNFNNDYQTEKQQQQRQQHVQQQQSNGNVDATTKAKTMPANQNSFDNNKVTTKGKPTTMETASTTVALSSMPLLASSATIVSRYAPQTYDAVWAIALALRGAEQRWRKDAIQQSKLDRFDYTRSDMASEFLLQMGKLDFLGVSVGITWHEVYFVDIDLICK